MKKIKYEITDTYKTSEKIKLIIAIITMIVIIIGTIAEIVYSYYNWSDALIVPWIFQITIYVCLFLIWLAMGRGN